MNAPRSHVPKVEKRCCRGSYTHAGIDTWNETSLLKRKEKKIRDLKHSSQSSAYLSSLCLVPTDWCCSQTCSEKLLIAESWCCRDSLTVQNIENKGLWLISYRWNICINQAPKAQEHWGRLFRTCVKARRKEGVLFKTGLWVWHSCYLHELITGVGTSTKSRV